MSFEVDEKNLNTAIERLKTSTVLPINKKHIIGFVKYSAADDRSKKRISKISYNFEHSDNFNKYTSRYGRVSK